VHMRRRLERHIDWEIAVRNLPLGLSYHNPKGHIFCKSERPSNSNTSMASGIGSARQTIALRRLCRLE
jgi:hypothetical protein